MCYLLTFQLLPRRFYTQKRLFFGDFPVFGSDPTTAPGISLNIIALQNQTPENEICLKFRLNDNSTEKAKITAAIAHTGGSMAQAARLLGITEKTLLVKRKKYGLK